MKLITLISKKAQKENAKKILDKILFWISIKKIWRKILGNRIQLQYGIDTLWPSEIQGIISGSFGIRIFNSSY